MPIANYTTQVAAMKSVGEIQGMLTAHGARSIMINFSDNQEPVSLAFLIKTTDGEVPFRLPANIEAVQRLLAKSLKSSYRKWDSEYQRQRDQKLKEQAMRVAWRVLRDWIRAQMAIIETEMVVLEQVFLPYMVTRNERTLYETIQEKRFLLTEGQNGQVAE